MIASLRGAVERSIPGEVVVDVAGVGYRVFVPLSTYRALPATHGPCCLRVVTVVREEEISLYGFATAEEEEIFRLLQGVSGVGPKLALKTLSGLTAPQVRQALVTGDVATLMTVSGVGKRLAQRLIVDLRDKVGSFQDGVPEAGQAPDTDDSEALAALESLGYPSRAARKALESARAGGAVSIEDLVRQALRTLAPRR